MKELNINSIDKRYLQIADIMENKNKLDELKFDNYYSFSMDVESVDYGYIKLADGSAEKVFVASSKADSLRALTLFISKDGITWHQVECPDTDVATLYSKIVIYCGKIYVLFDDQVKCLYDFVLEDDHESMSESLIYDDVQDITVVNNTMYMLTFGGVYTVDESNNVEFIELTADFPFDNFIPSNTSELVIMGYAGNYPMFLVYDGQPHLVVSTMPCKVLTAICTKDQIFCYTDNAKIVSVYKTFDMNKASYMLYPGHEWCGKISYFHSHFWMSYIERNGTDTYTLIAKSANGIDFDPDTRIPHTSEKDGISIWNGMNTYCLCAGSMFTLVSSINYFKYGKVNILKINDIDIENDGSVTIPVSIDIPDISKCDISVYICDDESHIVENDVKFESIPYMDGTDIKFNLLPDDYTDKHIYFVLEYVSSV